MVILRVNSTHTISVNSRKVGINPVLKVVNKETGSLTLITPISVTSISNGVSVSFDLDTSEGSEYYIVLESSFNGEIIEAFNYIAFCTEQTEKTPYKNTEENTGLKIF